MPRRSLWVNPNCLHLSTIPSGAVYQDPCRRTQGRPLINSAGRGGGLADQPETIRVIEPGLGTVAPAIAATSWSQ